MIDLSTVKAVEDPSKAMLMESNRHLKWRSFDIIERTLMALLGLCIFGFTASELGDVIFRAVNHPWLSAQEFSLFFFVWGVFLGAAAAVRRDQHFKLSAIANAMTGTRRLVLETFNRLVVLAVAFILMYFGYINYLAGFGSFSVPSGTPIAVLTAAIPVSGFFIALFTIEQLVNGWRRGFAAQDADGAAPIVAGVQ